MTADPEFWPRPAREQKSADLRIDNARIVNVFSGEIMEAPLCAAKGRILGFSRLEAKQVVDAGGGFLLPGLIDAHTHIESSLLCPARFAEAVLPRGVTTVLADPHEIANVAGLAGLRYMLEATDGLPLNVLFMLSSCVPALPLEDSGAVLKAEDLAFLMSHPRIAGLGEMMNTAGVLSGDAEVLAKIRLALDCGKRVDGHSPGLTGSALDAYIAAGISTDHECVSAEEFQERVRRGMYILLREGSASRDLLRLLPGVTQANARRCLFCTDDRHPADILDIGHIDNHLRLAVAAGLDPVTAVRMATLNAAECYGLERIGGLAPGWRADMVLVNDLREFRASSVWAGGQLVAERGRMLEDLPHRAADDMRGTVRLAPLPDRPFALRLPSGKARVIRPFPHSLITGHEILPVRVDGQGFFDFALNPGLLKIAVLERHHASGKMSVGLLDKIYGLRGGAIATSVAHDSHNLVVAGDNDADMQQAAEAVARLGGGVVMTAGGKILAELPLPVAGLMSELPAAQVAEKLRGLLRLAREHYHIWDQADAFMTLSFLALPVIPHLKITARGLFDVDAGRFVEVAVP
ncbi:MAG: adenine deaminase [Desulfarculales bacterium]|nr:adenine deaminase [Desulfarculales bacterium]